eukprot:gene12184-5771_t
MVVSLIVVGAGNRGFVYTQYALENPEKCKVIGVAEPREIPRKKMAQLHQIPQENIFKDWKELAKKQKFADAVIITTQDQMHVEPTITFSDLKYHILLEKPIAITKEGCEKLIASVEKNKILFSTGHVLRYTPMTQTVKKMVQDKVIGDILNIQHLEPVEHQHYSHSYVRGNWNNTEKSSFMLLAKSCHDIDWIHYILNDKCTKISSFGNLKHFNSINKPEGASERCLDCKVEKSCPYSAKKIYLERVKEGKKGWPTCVIIENGDIPDIENVTHSLKTTDYGRCVYNSNNNVVDNQVVIMEFESKATATFSMISTTKKQHRQTRIFGSLGQIEIDDAKIEHTDFVKNKTVDISYESIYPKGSKMHVHGGADWHLMYGFIEAVLNNDNKYILSGPRETLESHLLVFEAEKSRLEGKTIELE